MAKFEINSDILWELMWDLARLFDGIEDEVTPLEEWSPHTLETMGSDSTMLLVGDRLKFTRYLKFLFSDAGRDFLWNCLKDGVYPWKDVLDEQGIYRLEEILDTNWYALRDAYVGERVAS